MKHQVWSYSGSFPPGGLLDGQLSDLGLFRGCVDLKQPETGSHPATYCVLGFRPIIPSRKRFHLIFEREPEELLRLFKPEDYLTHMARMAQYFHYVYMKTGLCIPSECSPVDVQQVAKTVGRKLALMSAPVKCFTRAKVNSTETDLENLEDREPVLVDLNQRPNTKQLVSLALIGGFFSIVFAVTLWHCLEIMWRSMRSRGFFTIGDDNDEPNEDLEKNHNLNNHRHEIVLNIKPEEHTTSRLGTFKRSAFHYFSMITNSQEFWDISLRSSEIRCLHGLRTFSMVWIICVHTLQYNEWAGFTRIFENVASFQNPLVQPLINANYVVDNFFLMSGLLAAYTTWRTHSTKGSSEFSMAKSLLGRYLRLTPQVLLISLMYICLPLLGSSGPFWFDMTHYASKYCEKNWWVNLLHIQAFYRDEEMCNLVGWWISVDMFYYLIGLMLLWLILNKRVQLAFSCTCLYVAYCTFIHAWRHYTGGFEPNNLALVPQVQEVWTEFVIKFFWSPYPHAFVFSLGLWLGYMLANNLGRDQVKRWSRWGWFLSLTTLLTINMSSRLWTTGTLTMSPEKQYIATIYNVVCVFGWSSSLGWIIVACHYGCAPTLDRLLSTNLSVMLSKASFIIYLSHMLIVRSFFGSQYNLLEVSIMNISLIIVGMIVISTIFGVFLCIAFEGPCLKFQRLILSKIKTGNKSPRTAAFHDVELKQNLETKVQSEEDKNTQSPTSVTLLK
ncbi:nose resistant to fluoxetine 6-like [Olea europaea subsp. europaea]|uniref:Nose resistant to fluoxetine 6-like n=1 Tax=Olea europaea subsp. europaea TaxID=158383 RepID=A0A8S0TM80_OLEEU|nr:nose resistant to fluoxetine 6-like [Olea europaea subsp. europaea]